MRAVAVLLSVAGMVGAVRGGRLAELAGQCEQLFWWGWAAGVCTGCIAVTFGIAAAVTQRKR